MRRESRGEGVTAILLVEDEPEVRKLIEEAFAEMGLSLASAATDAAAYELLEREARSFDLLIADINLGKGTTGFDVARRARQLSPTIKVIYITGYAAQVDRFGVEDGEMFPKPFSPVELAERVKQKLH
jgi:CheY-like chemotaxis protein